MFVEWLSFVLVGVAALAVASAAGVSPRLQLIRNLLIAGVLMRIVGVIARYTMIFDLYDGGSDAVAYFDAGRVISEYFRALDFSIIGSGQWGEREWGTQAIRYAAGIVLTFVGPSVRGAFLVFSLAAFVGLACMAIAYGRAGRPSSMPQAAVVLFFWPTLWFWPSSIGKEAVLLLAVGLTTFGYVGRSERIHWLPLMSGLALALAIRPHLAGVLAVAMCVAEWTSREWTFRRVVQSLAVSSVAVWLMIQALDLMGLGGADLDAVQAFVVHAGEQTNQGGSSFARTSMAAAVPMSFVNILCRPFVTEATSAMALASSLEMVVFWGLALRNVRHLGSMLRSWRANRLLRFAIPFAVLYVLMIGLTFQNVGIIARQRALVMPALLLLFAVAPAPAMRPEAVRSAVPMRPPMRRVWAKQPEAGRALAPVRRPS